MSTISEYKGDSIPSSFPEVDELTNGTSYVTDAIIGEFFQEKLANGGDSTEAASICEYESDPMKENQAYQFIANLPVSARYKPLGRASSDAIELTATSEYAFNNNTKGYQYLPPSSPLSTFSDGLHIPRTFDLNYVTSNHDFIPKFSSDNYLEYPTNPTQFLGKYPDVFPISNPPNDGRSHRLKSLFKREFHVRFKFIDKKVEYQKIIESCKHDGIIDVKPFTNDFYELKNTKYKSIEVLKQDPSYRVVDSVKLSQVTLPSNLSREDEVYLCRLNIYELAAILQLDDYNIKLTKEIELNILELFKRYCRFNLGYQTWIRDTDKLTRRNLINQLYLITYYFYPELDKFQLEAIIRKGIYSLMQTRLRRDRRKATGIKENIGA